MMITPIRVLSVLMPSGRLSRLPIRSFRQWLGMGLSQRMASLLPFSSLPLCSILTTSTSMKHPEMVEWLEERRNGPSDMDIWGHEKSYYTFSDLMKWLKEAGDGVSVDLDSESDGWKKKGKKAMVKKKSSGKDGKRLHKSKAKSSGSKKL